MQRRAEGKNGFDALLVSMPWNDFRSPSLAVGALSAYAHERGFDVDALHLHIEAAEHIGLEDYDDVVWHIYKSCGDVLAAAILFPQREKLLIRYIEKSLPKAKLHLSQLKRTLKRLYKSIDWQSYSLVGFSINHAQLFTSVIFSKWLKRDCPEVKIVFGGRSVSDRYGRSLLKAIDEIDWCVDGEGEIALVELMKELRSGSLSEDRIPGLVFRSGSKIRSNPKRQLANLSKMPDPDYEHFFNHIENSPRLRNRHVGPYIPIEVTRGCTYRCAFCADYNHFEGYRLRPIEEVVASIDRMSRRYSVDTFSLNSLMIRNEYCSELFSRITNHRCDYRMCCQFRADLTKSDLIAMKTAGVSEITVGIEALDTAILKKMNKGLRFIDNLRILKHCEEIGLKYGVSSFIIYDFPTITQREMDRSADAMEFACGYEPPELAHFKLYPGCPVDDFPNRFGVARAEGSDEFGALLPDGYKKLNYWFKPYRPRRRPPNHRKFIKRHERWRADYDAAVAEGRPMLSFLDCRDFLRIEDRRGGVRSIILEGWMRDLYLFCDDIRSFDDIREHFSDVDAEDLKNALLELYRLKVMFKEGSDWLALAIRSMPKYRRKLPLV